MRTIHLEGLSVWCAEGGGGARGLRLRRAGPPLLPAPTHLQLQLELNCDRTHNGELEPYCTSVYHVFIEDFLNWT